MAYSMLPPMPKTQRVAGLPAPIIRPKRPVPKVFFADRPRDHAVKGYRTPAIDVKIQKVFMIAEQKSNDFIFVPHDSVIDILGDYNPLYGGRPKKLAMSLLNGVGVMKMWNNYMLHVCGLVYAVPLLVGVRGPRCRTSFAGLSLLEHWCQKFPKFKPFYDAYVRPKYRKQISSDCMDLIMGIRPKSFVDMDTLNIEYRLKYEAREYRRLMKEKEKELQKHMKAQSNQLNLGSQLSQQAYNDAYAQAINQQYPVGASSINGPWGGTTDLLGGAHTHSLIGNLIGGKR